MPRIALSLGARGLRAPTVALMALVVASSSGAVAVALGPSERGGAPRHPDRPRPTIVVAPQPQPDPPQPEAAGADAVAVAVAEVEAVAVAERAVPAPAARAAAAPRPTVVRPAAGAITGPFGERRGRSRHPGVDIDGETGDPVWAAAAGVVAWAGLAPAGFGGYGILVIVDHGDAVQTLYAHLSAVTVAAGERVEAGDRVGSIGTTGFVTGSHLHFEVRRGGVVADPSAFLTVGS